MAEGEAGTSYMAAGESEKEETATYKTIRSRENLLNQENSMGETAPHPITFLSQVEITGPSLDRWGL